MISVDFFSLTICRAYDHNLKSVIFLFKELERLRRENIDMQKDMKKMIRKHEKVQAKMKKLSELKQAQILLEAVVALVIIWVNITIFTLNCGLL